MKRTVRVLVAGCPSAGQPVQVWRKRTTFKIRGKKPEAPKDKEFEAFVYGSTNWLRKRILRALTESPELSRREILIEPIDGGEFMLDGATQYEGRTGFEEEGMADLAREFGRQAHSFDLVLLVGGDHAGGILLYSLPGLLARFDEHSDGCATPLSCPKGEVARNNYVCAAIRNGLKKPEEIVGVGVREGKAPHALSNHVKGAAILDIDVDVLAEKHGVKTRYSHGTLSPDDLVGAVRSNQPSAIGFFEATPGDEKAALLVVRLAIEAAVQAGLRKKKVSA